MLVIYLVPRPILLRRRRRRHRLLLGGSITPDRNGFKERKLYQLL